MERQIFRGHILTSKIGVSGSTTFRFFTLGPKCAWKLPQKPSLHSIRDAKWSVHGLYHIDHVKIEKTIISPNNLQLTFHRPFGAYLVVEQHFSDWAGSEFFDADTGLKAESDSLTLAVMQLWASKREQFINSHKRLYKRLTKEIRNETEVTDSDIAPDVAAIAEWVCA